MSLSSKLAKLQKQYKAAKAAPSGGFVPVPDGRYQARVDRAAIEEHRQHKYLLCAWTFTILEGPCANRKVFNNYHIGKTEQALGFLKRDLNQIGIETEDLEEALRQAIGRVVDIRVTTRNGFQNVWVNGLIQAPSDDDDDDGWKTDASDLDDDEDEEEDEDEAPKPKKTKKAKKAKKGKKTKKTESESEPEPEPDDDDMDDDDEDFDFDFDD